MSYLQLIHNWQHTGYQKQQFAQSKYQNRKDYDEDETMLIEKEIHRSGQCPYHCGHVETYLHCIVCPHSEARKKRATALNTLRTEPTQLNNYGAISSYMILGLTWDEGSNITPYTISLNRIDPIITQAVTEQSSIGWNNINEGYGVRNGPRHKEHILRVEKA